MFAIDRQDSQYQTYILSDSSADSRLEIVPERGGIATRWQASGRPMLYFDADRFANPELSVRGGIPILFPICGNLPDNTYTDGDKTYTLKQHGFARDLPWTVAESTTDNCASLTLTLESNDLTRAVYPFDFRLAFTYRLKGNTLEIIQRHFNLDDRIMPFSTGLHPYFLVSDKTQLQFDIPSDRYWDQKNNVARTFDGRFDLDLDEIDVAFASLTRESATVKDGDRQTSLTIEYNSLYSRLVFWTLKGKDYYCLEPWSGPRNAINTADSLIQLHPNSSLTTLVRFVVH
ncbi:MAG: aldose epimerase [Cyanobacteriota bacterium]|nr:aldose epimerase [Cyanobacteriota bacterium]